MKGYGFQNDVISNSTGDGRNCELHEYLEFIDKNGVHYRTKTKTDGLSVPRIFWSIIPPFGKLWMSGVIHDGAFRDKLEVLNPKTRKWQFVTLNEQACNDLIFDAMESQNATKLDIFLIYIVLQWFGWRAFDEDRKNLCIRKKPNHKVRKFLQIYLEKFNDWKIKK